VNDNFLVVGGVNKVKKHQKPNPVKGSTGGIVEIEKPIHASNVAIYNATAKKQIVSVLKRWVTELRFVFINPVAK